MTGVAHVVDVAGADALLHIGQAGAHRVLLTHQVGHQRVHTGGGEQHGGVVLGDDRRAGNAGVALLLEEAQEQAAQLVGGLDVHGNYLLLMEGTGTSSARKTLQWSVFSGSSAWKSVQWTDFSENGSADPYRWGRQARRTGNRNGLANSQFPIPNSQFPIPQNKLHLSSQGRTDALRGTTLFGFAQGETLSTSGNGENRRAISCAERGKLASPGNRPAPRPACRLSPPGGSLKAR